MQVLVTGVAGFIGFHVANALLDEAIDVVGIDNLNAYYDVNLKSARLDKLYAKDGFSFIEGDISERELFDEIRVHYPSVTHIVHLAAQAGVRQIPNQPEAYISSNISGQLQVLEYASSLKQLQHAVYASSSSVYSGTTPLPFREDATLDAPLSFYGVTKRSDELMAQHYHQLHGLPITGLRLFTAYGPYGRPDMAYYQFTKALFADEEITLFNKGQMRRDFTYINDTVDGILLALHHTPESHRLYNIGNGHAVAVTELLAALESETGKKARIAEANRQPTELVDTWADITQASEVLNFSPKTQLNEGVARFVAWFREHHNVS